MVDRSGWSRLVQAALCLLSISLVACWAWAVAGDPAGSPPGDAERGAALYLSLPCAGCHGATALGQFGPPLAGMTLSFEEVRRQVREPRNKMVPFPPEVVTDAELRDIYAWLESLPEPPPTDSAPLAPPTATAQARNRLFPEMDATTLAARMDLLDEVALRISGTVILVVEGRRYTQVRLQMNDGRTDLVVAAIYDTAMSREPFPAAAGDQVTLYGVGAEPMEIADAGSSTSNRLAQMQIVYVEPMLAAQ